MLLENKKQGDVSPVFSPVIKTGGKTKKGEGKQERAYL
jgi:hypothetical protein